MAKTKNNDQSRRPQGFKEFDLTFPTILAAIGVGLHVFLTRIGSISRGGHALIDTGSNAKENPSTSDKAKLSCFVILCGFIMWACAYASFRNKPFKNPALQYITPGVEGLRKALSALLCIETLRGLVADEQKDPLLFIAILSAAYLVFTRAYRLVKKRPVWFLAPEAEKEIGQEISSIDWAHLEAKISEITTLIDGFKKEAASFSQSAEYAPLLSKRKLPASILIIVDSILDKLHELNSMIRRLDRASGTLEAPSDTHTQFQKEYANLVKLFVYSCSSFDEILQQLHQLQEDIIATRQNVFSVN